MTTIMTASHQWASRPADQRFTSLLELQAFTASVRERSIGKTISSRAIEARPVEGDHRALVVVGPNGAPVAPTNWAFGQLAQLAKAPPSYLRELPGALAADCINHGLMRRDVEDVGVLLHKNPAGAQLQAITGPNYGRVWNSAIANSLVEKFGDGVSGHWRVPGEFGKRVQVTKENTTIYASDRDMFVFLADEDRRIELPGRRNGQAGSLARGFFIWNSDVGSRSLGIAFFLFDYVCCNRIVWGAQQYEELRISHTASAPDRWLEEVTPVLQSYSTASSKGIEQAIADARQTRIDDVDAFLQKRFSKTQVGAIKASHLNDEGRPIETLWDAATGITAYARGIEYQDKRIELEREAGKLLDVSAS